MDDGEDDDIYGEMGSDEEGLSGSMDGASFSGMAFQHLYEPSYLITTNFFF
jgi:hypothetical protein